MLTNPLKTILEKAGVVILDGALATELERRGADIDDPLWSAKLLLENPALIREVHHDYFLAGADVATSASYQATFAGFALRGLDAQRAAESLRLSVRLAQEAREQFWAEPANRAGRVRPLVAASVGCYGAFLHDGSEYRGDYGLSRAQLVEFHRPRLQVLAQSGADLLACETIPCRVEAEALIEVLAEFPDVPAWISFSCKDEEHMCHGERLAECVEAVDACAQVVAVGVNCTPPQYVRGLLESVAGKTRKSLLAYPNRGDSWDAQAHCWRVGTDAPTDWGALARQWYSAGARLIGGCCRTTPEEIRQIARGLRKSPPGHGGDKPRRSQLP
jgi:homocysteine S-methyltransferase